MRRARGAAALVLALALALPATGGTAAADDWREFAGTWTVMGQRRTLPTGGPRPAAIAQLSGSVVLDGVEGLGRGFLGEAIAFTDGDSLRTGRMVWTDDHGDLVYGVLAGELLATGQRITGTFTGGTGRYAGLEGTFEFVWQYAAEAGEGVVQGFAVDLRGRVRGGGGAR
jgi:hypothetical protein